MKNLKTALWMVGFLLVLQNAGVVIGQKRRSSSSASLRSSGASFSSTSSGQPVDFDCPEEFGYYAHPGDCTQYYVCVFGGALLESCTGGLMYSHELQTCDWPRNVGCAGAEASAQQQTELRQQPQRSHQQITTNSNSRARQQSAPSARTPLQPHRETIPVPKHDLYTEEELGPAEEIETDRQQRVYRGQPPTIGQVASDRDAIAHTNAIPIRSGSGRDKLSVVSYGSQQQYTSYDQLTNLEDTRLDNSDHNFLTNTRSRLKRHALWSHRTGGMSRNHNGRPWTPAHPFWLDGRKQVSLIYPQPNPPPFKPNFHIPNREARARPKGNSNTVGFTFGLADARVNTNRHPAMSQSTVVLILTSPSTPAWSQPAPTARPQTAAQFSSSYRGFRPLLPSSFQFVEQNRTTATRQSVVDTRGVETKRQNISSSPANSYGIVNEPISHHLPPEPTTPKSATSSSLENEYEYDDEYEDEDYSFNTTHSREEEEEQECDSKYEYCEEENSDIIDHARNHNLLQTSQTHATQPLLYDSQHEAQATPYNYRPTTGSRPFHNPLTTSPPPPPHNSNTTHRHTPTDSGQSNRPDEDALLLNAYTQRTLTHVRASVAPEQAYIESPSAQPSRNYNATQYIAQEYEPFYALYDEEPQVYKDNDYSLYSGTQNSEAQSQRFRSQSGYKGRKQQPTVEIVQDSGGQRRPYTKTKYNTQQDLYQSAVVPSDYETYSIQTNDDIQYRPLQTKSSNRLAPIRSGGTEEVLGSKEENVSDQRSSLNPDAPTSSSSEPVPYKDDGLNQLMLTDRYIQTTQDTGKSKKNIFVIQVTTTTPSESSKYDIIRTYLEEQGKKDGEAPRPFSRAREENVRGRTREPATQKPFPSRAKIVEDYAISSQPERQTRYQTAEESPSRNRVAPEIAAIVQEYTVTRRTPARTTSSETRRKPTTPEVRRRIPISSTTPDNQYVRPKATTESTIASFERELEKFNNLTPTIGEPRQLTRTEPPKAVQDPVRNFPESTFSSSSAPPLRTSSSVPRSPAGGRQCTTDCAERQTSIRVKPTSFESQTTPGYIRGTTRHRGSLTYTLSPNEAEPPNRGTPPARVRPTLKPSTSFVSKAAEFVDIYKFPPRRPDPVYPTPQVDKTAAKCRKDVCLLPDCYCGGKDVPGDLPMEETPQIVLLTFDDSVNDLNKGLYSDLFEKGRTNPNGCPIAATFYVSHEWTDYSQVQNLYATGHEIASHSVSHSFGEQFSQKKWTKEIAGQREILSAYGGVRQEDIRGMRAPFLAIGGNKMFKMLYDANFTYDSSMPVYENKPPSWPYTMDYKIFHDCMIPPCPTRSYPGVWEVPMVMWQDLKGGRCSMGDACSNPPTSDGVYKMLLKNFDRHFTSNRAPFGLFYHAAWFTQPHHKEGFIQFIDTIVQMPEVWLVTNWQAIEWVRDPTPISRLNSFAPFQCNYPERPKKCNNPKVCNLWHKSGVRYMRTCQPCPEVYPWTGKTGVRNSRVDMEVFPQE